MYRLVTVVNRTAGPASGSVFPLGTTTMALIPPITQLQHRYLYVYGNGNEVQPPTVTCPANIAVSNTVNQCGAIVTFTPVAADTCPIGTTTPVTINQWSSATVTAGSVSCNDAGLHTDNSYWRAYDLAPLALVGPYTNPDLRFGVRNSQSHPVWEPPSR